MPNIPSHLFLWENCLFLKSIFWLIILGTHYHAMYISLMFAFIFTVFFSALFPCLVFLEPEGRPCRVYDLLGKRSGRLSSGTVCLWFWKLELDNSKGHLGGQRDACFLEQQHIESMLLGADIAEWGGWLLCIHSPEEQLLVFPGFLRNGPRNSNESVNTVALPV